MIVPRGIVALTGLFREIVVRPAAVITPVMFVLAWTPLTVFLTS